MAESRDRILKILWWGSVAGFVTWALGKIGEREVSQATTAPRLTGNFRSDFIARIWDAANKEAASNGWSRDALITQGAEESDWGRSQLASVYNNLFGFKADASWKAAGKPFVNLPTTEYQNGKLVNTKADFRVYGSWDESISDLIRLLSTYPRYAKVKEAALALGQGKGDLTTYFTLLKASGYNTDPTYDTTLVGVYNAARPYLVA